MKIAYIIDTDISSENSILEKISAQVRIWEKDGNKVVIFSLLSKNKVSLISNGIICQNITEFDSKLSYIKAVSNLKYLLNEYNPDILYIRYIRYIPGLIGALKSTNSPYIVEINTNDIEENKLGKMTKRFYNSLTRNFLLSNASAFVCVTSELKNNKYFKKFNKASIVLANGIDTNLFKNSIRKSNNRCVFIGTAKQSWQGFEKVLDIAKYIPYITFDVIGISKEDLKDFVIPSNVKIHGFVPLKDNMKIIQQAIVGIGTLSLYKKNMNEACALKTRQYLAQGLPVILGYSDTDIMEKKLDFILEIANKEDNVKQNLIKIEEFINSMKYYDSSIIVKFSKDSLDIEVKERKRLEFMRSILDVFSVS
jgi:glycosyltransferase involved in cell wall biosynthesis